MHSKSHREIECGAATSIVTVLCGCAFGDLASKRDMNAAQDELCVALQRSAKLSCD
jgi:hypothetical protein